MDFKKDTNSRKHPSRETNTRSQTIQRIGPQGVMQIPCRPISQAELRTYYELQAAAWKTEQLAHAAALDMARRLKLGAQLEDGPLTFDPERQMVRTRKLG